MTSDGREISDLFACVLTAELTRLVTALLEKETDPEKRWQQLREVHRELSELRRDDHRAVRTMIKLDPWNQEIKRKEEEAEQGIRQERKHRLWERRISAFGK